MISLVILFLGFVGLLVFIGIPLLFIGAKVADKYDEHKGVKDYKIRFSCPVCGKDNIVWYKAGTKKGSMIRFTCWNCKKKLEGKI